MRASIGTSTFVGFLVDLAGFEPATFSLQGSRSTNWSYKPMIPSGLAAFRPWGPEGSWRRCVMEQSTVADRPYQARSGTARTSGEVQSDWRVSNPRPPRPQRGALPTAPQSVVGTAHREVVFRSPGPESNRHSRSDGFTIRRARQCSAKDYRRFVDQGSASPRVPTAALHVPRSRGLGPPHCRLQDNG